MPKRKSRNEETSPNLFSSPFEDLDMTDYSAAITAHILVTIIIFAAVVYM